MTANLRLLSAIALKPDVWSECCALWGEADLLWDEARMKSYNALSERMVMDMTKLRVEAWKVWTSSFPADIYEQATQHWKETACLEK